MSDRSPTPNPPAQHRPAQCRPAQRRSGQRQPGPRPGWWLATALLAASASAQPPPKAPTPLPQVAIAAPGATVHPMRSCAQGLCMDGLGQLWCLVLERATRPQPGQHLWLHRSADGGDTWQQVARVPFGWSESAAIVGRPDDPLLHLACGGGRPGERFQSALYGTFDVRTWTWSAPVCLALASSEIDQYHVWDLAAAADGTLLAVVGTRAGPPAPWPGPWSAGAFRLPVGDRAWQGPHVLHQTHTATWVQAQWRGTVAEFAYRTRSPAPGQAQQLRLATSRWPNPANADSDALPAAGAHTPGNTSSFVLDASGRRSILFAGYTTQPRQPHALVLAHAPADGPWTCTVVAEDPNLPLGEIAHQHFALARGPGDQVVALYSLATEVHRVLYRRTFEAGQPLEAARVIARSQVGGAFARLLPFRDDRCVSRLEAVVGGDSEATPLGVRAILRPGPAHGRWLVPPPAVLATPR